MPGAFFCCRVLESRVAPLVFFDGNSGITGFMWIGADGVQASLSVCVFVSGITGSFFRYILCMSY